MEFLKNLLLVILLCLLVYWLRTKPFREKKTKEPERTARATLLDRRVESGTNRSGRSSGMGYSYVLTFRGAAFYRSIFILVLVNIIHFFSSPYLLAYNSLSKLNPNLEDVAQSLGISRMRTLLRVYIPSTQATIVEMYSYFFVNAMITISAVSFLVSFRTMPLSLMIPQLESQSFIEGTALISLLILGVNLAEKGIAFFVKRRILRQALRDGNDR